MKIGKKFKPQDYIVVSSFMIHDLQLKGVKLLAYATIYGYSRNDGGCFFGSMDWLADWLGVSKRSVVQLVGELEADGLIKQIGNHRQGSHETKKYIVNTAVVEQAIQAFDSDGEVSGEKISPEHLSDEKNSSDQVKKFHLSGEKISPDHNNSIYNNKINNNIGNNQGTALCPSSNPAVKEIVGYFIAQSKKKVVASEEDFNLISHWLSAGYTVEDCKRVIDVKCSQWLGDQKMNEWVRLQTLFGGKFTKYVTEPVPLEVMYRGYDFDM